MKDTWFKGKDPNGYTFGSWAKKYSDHELFSTTYDKYKVGYGFYHVTLHAQTKRHLTL